MYTALCLCLTLVAATQAADLKFSVEPTVFDVTTPRTLTLNCTLDFDPLANLRLTKLAIWNATHMLVSDDVFSGNKLVKSDPTFQDSAGFINPRGESYIFLVKKNIVQADLVEYRCVGTFIDSFGTIVDKEVKKNVTGTLGSGTTDPVNPDGSSPTLKQLTDALARVTVAQKFFDGFLFYNGSDSYHGHTYYLSRIPLFDLDLAQETCKIIKGGYLAEVEDQSEQDKIASYLNDLRYDGDVVIGATDEAKSGTWVSPRDAQKGVSTYISGLINAASSGIGHCAKLMGIDLAKADKTSCTDNTARYVCEVEK